VASCRSPAFRLFRSDGATELLGVIPFVGPDAGISPLGRPDPGKDLVNRDRPFRQFSIADLSSKILGIARSAWLVLDLKSRKPQKIEPLFKPVLHLFDPLSPAEEPEKLPAPTQPASTKSYGVRYSDIDIHHHVNNIRYIEWILDSVPLEMNQTHQIHTFEINFLAESSYEDVLLIETETFQEFPPVFLHRVSREGEGKELCRARTGWKKGHLS
jgi:medium-chain acyl-[acyl-carrier-protein] hydrolase